MSSQCPFSAQLAVQFGSAFSNRAPTYDGSKADRIWNFKSMKWEAKWRAISGTLNWKGENPLLFNLYFTLTGLDRKNRWPWAMEVLGNASKSCLCFNNSTPPSPTIPLHSTNTHAHVRTHTYIYPHTPITYHPDSLAPTHTRICTLIHTHPHHLPSPLLSTNTHTPIHAQTRPADRRTDRQTLKL